MATQEEIEAALRLSAVLKDNDAIFVSLSENIEKYKKAMEEGTNVTKNKIAIMQTEAQQKAIEIQNAEAMLELIRLEDSGRAALLAKSQATVASKSSELRQTEAELRSLDAKINYLNSLGPLTDEQEEKLEKLKNKQQKLLEVEEKLRKEHSDALELNRKINDLNTQINTTTEATVKQQQQQIINNAILNEQTKSLTGLIYNSIKATAGIQDGYAGIIQASVDAGGATDLLKVGLNSIGGAFKDLLNPVNLLSSAFLYAQNNFEKFYESLFKVTREIGSNSAIALQNMTSAGKNMGISMEEQISTVDALSKSFVGLGDMSVGAQKTLLETSYSMQRMGVNAADSTKILAAFDRSLGESTDQSSTLALSLVETAKQLNLSSDAVGKLAANMDMFVVYGSKANEVMTETLKVSQQFNLAADSVTKFANNMDDFDKAVTLSNTLARDFGGSLDYMALVKADAAEKTKILARALADADVSAESGRRRLMNLADDAGITATELLALVNSQKEVEESASGMTRAYGYFQEIVAKYNWNGLKQIEIFIQNIAKPIMIVFEALNIVFGIVFWAINGLIGLLDSVGVPIGSFFALMIVGTFVVGNFSAILSFLTGLLPALGGGIASLIPSITGLIASIAAAAPSLIPSIPVILAFAAAIFLVGVGIGIAAAGFAYFASVFKDMTAEQILATAGAFVIFSVSIIALGFALTKFGAIASIGLSTLYAFGIAAIVLGLALTYLNSELTELSESISSVVTALSLLNGITLPDNLTLTISQIIKPINEIADAEGFISKAKAVGDMSLSVKQYTEAMGAFNTAGGAATSEAMVIQLKEVITTIQNTATATTETTNAAPTGISGPASVNIYLGDDLLVKSAFADIIYETMPVSGP